MSVNIEEMTAQDIFVQLETMDRQRTDLQKRFNEKFIEEFRNEEVPEHTGKNIGDWSEIYTFFRILEQGKINTADDEMNVIYEAYLPVLKIFREEDGNKIDYYTANEGNGPLALKICYHGIKEPLSCMSVTAYRAQAEFLLRKLQEKKAEGQTSSIIIPETFEFLDRIFIRKIKAPASSVSELFGDKIDITLEVSQSDNLRVPAGFSIKSELGSKSTLINASGANDVHFLLYGCDDVLMNEINESRSSGKKWVVNRVRAMQNAGITFCYDRFGYDDDTMMNNLSLISDRMPEVVAYSILSAYLHPVDGGDGNNNKMTSVVNTLCDSNPLDIESDTYLYYSKRLKDFLFEFACGMQSATPWDGTTKIRGGYIFVKKNGEILAYYASEQDNYKNWLFNNTFFETPSSSRHERNNRSMGFICKDEDGSYYFTLGLQVKFNQ